MEKAAQGGDPGSEQARDAACPGCGLTRADLYQEGRMGCAACYDAFESEVLHALSRIHGAVEHIGKP